MKPWLLYSVLTLVLWGGWGFLGKVSSLGMPERTLLLLGSLGFALTFPVVWALFPRALRFDLGSFPFYAALLSGLFAGIGVVFFYRAIALGDASRVVAFTAMYPLVTVLLSVLVLRETMSAVKCLGVLCPLAAAVLLSL